MAKQTRWFIHPQNSHTNEVVARELDSRASAEAASILEVGGKDLDLWDLPFDKLEQILNSARRLGLRFAVYKREGSGAIQKAPNFFQIKGWKRRPRPRPRSQKAPF